MSKADIAEEYFRGGLNCAQSVLLAFAGDLGADAVTAERISRGFGSGMSTGDTCGAVSGGVMAISLYVGDGGDISATKKRTYSLAREFKRLFSEEAESLTCRGLLGFDITDPKILESLPMDQRPRIICVRYVRLAAGILEDMFEE